MGNAKIKAIQTHSLGRANQRGKQATGKAAAARGCAAVFVGVGHYVVLRPPQEVPPEKFLSGLLSSCFLLCS